MFAKFKKFEKFVGKDTEIKPDEDEAADDIPKELALQFAARKAAFNDLTDKLEAKYKAQEAEQGERRKKKKVSSAGTGRGVKVGGKKAKFAAKGKAKKAPKEEDLDEGEEVDVDAE